MTLGGVRCGSRLMADECLSRCWWAVRRRDHSTFTATASAGDVCGTAAADFIGVRRCGDAGVPVDELALDFHAGCAGGAVWLGDRCDSGVQEQLVLLAMGGGGT